jgi:hypothetical protein
VEVIVTLVWLVYHDVPHIRLKLEVADVFAEGEEITWTGYNSEVNLLTGDINYFYGDVVTKIVFTLE